PDPEAAGDGPGTPCVRRSAPAWLVPAPARRRKSPRGRREDARHRPAGAPFPPICARRRHPRPGGSWQRPADGGDIGLELLEIVKTQRAPAFLDLIDHGAELVVQPHVGTDPAAVFDQPAVGSTHFRGPVPIHDVPPDTRTLLLELMRPRLL